MRHIMIVLNYNDWETVRTLISRIGDYTVYDKIILVDNASTDDSVKHLRELANDRIEVIVNRKNEGYARGNNFGIFYAIRTYHPEFLTIANPDIYVEERVVRRMEEVLTAHKRLGLVSAMVQKGCNAWNLPGYFGVLQSLFPLHRWLKKNLVRLRLKKSRAEFEPVDVVEGSMFCVKAEAMEKAGGFESKTFLYVEENMLAARLRRAGYRSAILPGEIYYHYHSVCVGKHYKKKTQIFKFISDSYRIYCTDYLHIGPVRKAVFEGAVKLAFLERSLYDHLMMAKDRIHRP